MKLSMFSYKGFCKAALSSVVVLGVVSASGSFAATDTATTTALVVVPIAIENAQDLSFGEFAAGPGAPGTVVLTTAGAASATGGVVLTGGTAAAAQFTVTGHTDASFSISISDNDLTHSDTTTTMTFTTVHDFDAASENSLASGSLTSGIQTIYVGGTLAVDAAQLAGTYTGSITATVEYN